jgi:DEAD/DEAH box helicase domain-containing protein
VTLCPACHQRAELAVRVRSGLTGLAFVLGHLAPLSLMCDVRDLGTYADPRLSFACDRPGAVIYDQVPAGIGFSERLFELHAELMARAHDLVGGCECVDGCPSCVGPAGEQGVGGKRETLAMLRLLC